MNEFTPYITRWISYSDYVRPAAKQLYHWAHYAAFQVMVGRIDQARTLTGLGEEVGRMQILLTHFLSVLNRDADMHIRMEENSIIDTSLLGDFDAMRKWQDAGYNPMLAGSVPRNASTYSHRVKVWSDIFDGQYTKNGVPVTYEQVIGARMSFGIKHDSVPYWMLWNYGSDYKTGRSGYPAYPGLHFLELGESSITGFVNQAKRYLESFMVRLIRSNRFSAPRVLTDKRWQEVYTSTYGGERLLVRP